MATDAGVAHAFAGERKAAFVERHTVRLLLARFDRFFRLLDYILVETRRHLLLSTLSQVHTVLTDAFEGANIIGTPSPFLQLRLELDLPDGEEVESPSSRQRQVTIATTPTDDAKTPSQMSRADGAYTSPESNPNLFCVCSPIQQKFILASPTGSTVWKRQSVRLLCSEKLLTDNFPSDR